MIWHQAQVVFLEWLYFKSKNIQFPHQTVLSNFDIHIGPTILFVDLENQEMNKFNIKDSNITSLMDIHSKGDFFIHYFDKIISINYFFEVNDVNIRGGSHQFMISVVFQNLDKFCTSKIFENIDEFKIWSKNIEESVQEQKFASELIDLKITCELNEINHNINKIY